MLAGELGQDICIVQAVEYDGLEALGPHGRGSARSCQGGDGGLVHGDDVITEEGI